MVEATDATGVGMFCHGRIPWWLRSRYVLSSLNAQLCFLGQNTVVGILLRILHTYLGSMSSKCWQVWVLRVIQLYGSYHIGLAILIGFRGSVV